MARNHSEPRGRCRWCFAERPEWTGVDPVRLRTRRDRIADLHRETWVTPPPECVSAANRARRDRSHETPRLSPPPESELTRIPRRRSAPPVTATDEHRR